ncbi:MAG: PBP1A family penicillin-binding protein [Actinomycetota bacterium]|nr:PBP1A family penicillin-binding protein [Actinomycetota bacterium]
MRRLVPLLLLVLVVGAACSYRSRVVRPQLDENALSSRIYAADGSLLTVLHGEENRENVGYEQMPQVLVDAVVAVEDERFWLHKGVDARAILRAVRTNALSGSIAEGGSTITQQLVKNALLTPEQSLDRKIEEAALAYQVERTYSKEQILEIYLNTIYFGRGAYGVQAASREYFDHDVEEITLPEAAMLAALIQSPSSMDPYDEPEPVIERRNLVLGLMAGQGYIDDEAAETARLSELELAPEFTDDDRYPAGHFVEEVKQFVMSDPRFGATREDRVKLLFAGGLRIRTTIDLEMQAQATEAIAETLPDPATYPDAAVVTVEPGTGHVLTMVGGRDFFGESAIAKYNLAVGSGRQAGSSFKPITLAAALRDGIPVTQTYPAPGTIELDMGENAPPWRVSNYGGGGSGRTSLVTATINSYNTVYAQLIMDVGPQRLVDMAADLGIASPIQPVFAATLGTENVTVLDMATAYSTFANRGERVDPTLVTRITDAEGTVLYEHRPTPTPVLEPELADQLTWVLTQGVERGTGTRAQLPDRPAAGKTGTAQDWRDAWFVGYTPELATAVWVGYPTEQISMTPPRTPIRVTGGSWPATIWSQYMTMATVGSEPSEFSEPPSSTTSTTRPTAQPGTIRLVPDLTGWPVGRAYGLLSSRGILARVVRVPDEQWAPGVVLGQDAEANRLVPPGTIVTLTVSANESSGTRPAIDPDAPPPTTTTTTTPPPTTTSTTTPSTTTTTSGTSTAVPGVVGLTVGEAESAVLSRGFVVSVIRQDPGDDIGPSDSDLVWRQDPPPESTISSGGTVTLWVTP